MKTPIQQAKEQSAHQLADQIAAMLGETEASARYQIYYLLMVLGKDAVFEILRATLAIEQAGGQMSVDGSTRRSPGGTFFTLAKKEPYKAMVQAYRVAQQGRKKPS